MPVILERISSQCRGGKTALTREAAAELEKIWKACNFFLIRGLRTYKPCLRRTLVLYDWCCRKGFEAEVMIGVYKQDSALKGHSWLILEGVPFREETEELEKYTVMLKG